MWMSWLTGRRQPLYGEDLVSRTEAPSRLPRRLQVGLRSVSGPHRRRNEDRVFASPAERLFLVLDGMGGHRGGAEASRLVLQELLGHLRADLPPHPDLATFQQVVDAGLERARESLVAASQELPDLQNMGATFVVAYLDDGRLLVASVGDCRAYLFRDHRLLQLTRDETVIQGLIDYGVITLAEARNHPMRHYVANCVNGRCRSTPLQTAEYPWLPDDRLLLASDGLTGTLDEADLECILGSPGHPQSVANVLVLEALRRDSHDNVTCLVVEQHSQVREAVAEL